MKRYDRIIFLLSLLLSLIGLPVIHTASWKWASITLNNPSYFSKHQLIYLPLSIGIALFVSIIPINFWKKFSFPLLILGFIGLILVFIPPFGKVSRNVARWIEIGPIQIQPIEIMRFTWIVFLAQFLSLNKDKKLENIRLTWIMIFLFFISFLLYLQPNVSMIILFSLSTFIILFISNMNYKQTAILALILILFIGISVLTGDYRKQRIVMSGSFFPPFSTYQQNQALNAIRDGGLLGKGWGRGNLKLYIPEAYNDFLLPVIFEEGGLVAGTFIIFIYVLLILTIFYLSLNISKKDLFSGLLSMGILVFWSIEIMLNILMNIGFLPVMGLPLPFLSFGGSALIVNWAQVGLLMRLGSIGDRK